MKTPYWMAALGLSGLIGFLGISPLLQASGLEGPPANSTAMETAGKGTPKIQFETNFYDFGKVTGVESVSGVFKFKNAGDSILKVSQPKPSCGCTDAKVKPEALAPGETGELSYTIKLTQGMHGTVKRMQVHSNDPQTPDVVVSMHVDYTPLYELSPMILRLTFPAGKDEVKSYCTVTRTDSKPLGIERLTVSPAWVSAAWEPDFNAEGTSARLTVTVHRPARPPELIAANVRMWATNQAAHPVSTLFIAGEFQRELVAHPPRLYWVLPDYGPVKANYPAESLTREVELQSVLGKPVELKNAATDIKGLSVKIVPKDAGKTFDLALTFDQLPQTFINGKVSVETSLAALPRLEVPVTVAVANPK